MSDLSAVSEAVARGPKSCKWCGNINLHPEDPWCPDCRFRLAAMIASRSVALDDDVAAIEKAHDLMDQLKVLDRWHQSDPLYRSTK